MRHYVATVGKQARGPVKDLHDPGSGALLGGLLLGLIESWGSSLFGSDQNIGNVAAFVTLVLVLMVRPSGLLGESLGRSKA